MIEVKYDRSQKVWVANYVDHLGVLGNPTIAPTREAAVFQLGVNFGRNQSEFSRSLSDFTLSKPTGGQTPITKE